MDISVVKLQQWLVLAVSFSRSSETFLHCCFATSYTLVFKTGSYCRETESKDKLAVFTMPLLRHKGLPWVLEAVCTIRGGNSLSFPLDVSYCTCTRIIGDRWRSQGAQQIVMCNIHSEFSLYPAAGKPQILHAG